MTATINIITLAVMVLFLYAAWSDFIAWRIPNAVVATLVGLYVLAALVRVLVAEDIGAALFAFTGVGGDVGAGLLLFVLGAILWSFGLFGAGDAKLFLPIGLFVGWHGMMPFSIFLMIGGVATLLALRLPVPMQVAHLAFFMRLDEIRASRKVPYGVIMVLAALATMAMRHARA